MQISRRVNSGHPLFIGRLERSESIYPCHQWAIKKISPGKALIYQGFLLFSGEIFQFDFVDGKWVFSGTERI